jgi:hypothetical protein
MTVLVLYTCLAEDFLGWIWAFCGNGLGWFS